MIDDERRASEDRPRSGRGNFELWFYQRRGDRYYLRLTGLGLVLIIVPTLLAIIWLIVIYVQRVNAPPPAPDIEIRRRPESTPTGPLIRQPPQPRPVPKVPLPEVKSAPLPERRSAPKPVNSNAAVTPTPRGNTNE